MISILLFFCESVSELLTYREGGDLDTSIIIIHNTTAILCYFPATTIIIASDELGESVLERC